MTKALVVDDSRAMRPILSKTLAEFGFEVSQAATDGRPWSYGPRGRFLRPGSGRLEHARDHRPGVLRAFRARPELSGVRLMMVTTETEIEQMARALEAGANEYIMKPFTSEAVKDKLRLMGVLTCIRTPLRHCAARGWPRGRSASWWWTTPS